jgi:hypothetical protein
VSEVAARYVASSSSATRELGVELRYLEKIAHRKRGTALGGLPAEAAGLLADVLLRGLGVGGAR